MLATPASGCDTGIDALKALIEAGLSSHQVQQNALTLLIAGAQDAGNTLVIALYALARHPETQKRVQAEIDSLFTSLPSGDAKSGAMSELDAMVEPWKV